MHLGAITPRTRVILPCLWATGRRRRDSRHRRRRSLRVIEDAAQAHGARVRGRPIGARRWSHGASHPGKNLGALGDAGAVTTDDAVVADRVRVLRNYGSRVKYQNEVRGYNSRLDEIQACGAPREAPMPRRMEREAAAQAQRYACELSATELSLPVVPRGRTRCGISTSLGSRSRDALRAHLLDSGIDTLIHYRCLPTAAGICRPAIRPGRVSHRVDDRERRAEVFRSAAYGSGAAGRRDRRCQDLRSAVMNAETMSEPTSEGNGPRSGTTLLSIVVPVYFNAMNLPDTIPQLLSLESQAHGLTLELVFVDDGSGDDSLAVLRSFQAQHPERIRIVKLTRNFGSMAAILAGLTVARGDCVGMIAADLQDPPELFLDMLAHWRAGSKAVFAVRTDREDSASQRLFARAYYSLIRRFALRDYPAGGFDFFLVDRQVVRDMVRIGEKNTNLMSLIFWLGYRPVMLPYVRRAREKGKSRWTLAKKIKLFIDSFVAFSYVPIRFPRPV